MQFDENEVDAEAPRQAQLAKAAPEPEAAAPPAVKPEAGPKAAARPEPKAKPAPAPTAPAIPTRNLPRDPAKASDVLVHRALPMIRNGELKRAEATLDRAWELDPKNPQAMAGYARLVLAKKDGARAKVWAERAVRKRSRRAEYHVLYGDVLMLEDDRDGARKAWRKALAVDPDNRSAKARLSETGARVAN